jgi:hypothetical protein
MQRAHGLGLDTKVARGDRAWLTGMAAKSLGVACRIEQFLMLAKREGAGGEEDESSHRATDRMIKQARAEVAKVFEKAGVGRGRRE